MTLASVMIAVKIHVKIIQTFGMKWENVFSAVD